MLQFLCTFALLSTFRPTKNTTSYKRHEKVIYLRNSFWSLLRNDLIKVLYHSSLSVTTTLVASSVLKQVQAGTVDAHNPHTSHTGWRRSVAVSVLSSINTEPGYYLDG